MKSKKSLYLILGILAAAVVLAIICWFTLPDPVSFQFMVGGVGGAQMSKVLAISIALGANILGVVLYHSDDSDKRSLVFSAAGMVFYLILILINLIRI